MSKDAPARPKDGSYVQRTRMPLNNLAVVAPLLIFYHTGAAVYRSSQMLLAPEYLRGLLDYFGASAAVLAPLSILILLLADQIVHHHRWQVHLDVVAGMIGESVLWTTPLIAASYLRARLAHPAAMFSGENLAIARRSMDLALKSVGAGVYEEFIFRLLLISLILILAVEVFKLRREIVLPSAIVVAAALFSLCHFSVLGGGDSFTWGSFTFRFLAGVLLGAVFVLRGFGVAVGAHVCWNLFFYLC